MRLALKMDPTEENLKFAKQIGVTDIIAGPGSVTGDRYWEFQPLLRLRTRVESAGLRLAAIENLPREHYDKIPLGLPGRDEQIDNWGRTLRNMGASGISILGYHWFPLVSIQYWRTSIATPTRGGARATSFDYDLVKNAPLTEYGEIGDEKMWEDYEYFLKRIIPVAEEAGVKMALHPDDPPISPIVGIARIFSSPEAFRRVIATVPSEYNGLEFCQGCFSEMGTDIIEAIRYFGSRKKIFYVHFRDVQGGPTCFAETFIDEGQTDMFKAMQTYKEVGFDGPMVPDHMPSLDNDTPYGHATRAYALGYMKALMRMLESTS